MEMTRMERRPGRACSPLRNQGQYSLTGLDRQDRRVRSPGAHLAKVVADMRIIWPA